jgi:FKBP-type peptidyl-prolyl cis-trans isomerase SlyD
VLIKEKNVVTMDFQLFAEDGRLVENRKDFEFIQGIDDVLIGMRSYLEGAEIGDCIEGKASAEEAFGKVVDFEPVVYPKEVFGQFFHRLYIGLGVPFETEDGTSVVLYVKELTSTSATLTTNHPLAGQEIGFIATINAIREATEDEINQGRPIAHGSSCSCC